MTKQDLIKKYNDFLDQVEEKYERNEEAKRDYSSSHSEVKSLSMSEYFNDILTKKNQVDLEYAKLCNEKLRCHGLMESGRHFISLLEKYPTSEIKEKCQQYILDTEKVIEKHRYDLFEIGKRINENPMLEIEREWQQGGVVKMVTKKEAYLEFLIHLEYLDSRFNSRN